MGSNTVLIDTGPIVALLRRNDADKARCEATMEKLPTPLVTTWPVITEVCWLVRREPDGVAKLFDGLRVGLLAIGALDEGAPAWIAAFMARYRSIGAQLADASLAYLAERLDIRTVFTLDRRDFSVYRLRGNRALRVVPA